MPPDLIRKMKTVTIIGSSGPLEAKAKEERVTLFIRDAKPSMTQ
jgi:hypothetical protein